MPFLSSLQTQHARYVEVNGQPPGPPPVWNPTLIPDPLERGSWWSRIEDLIVIARALATLVRR